MNIGTYLQNESQHIQEANRLHTFENVPERDQSSFFDDIDEREVFNDVVGGDNDDFGNIRSSPGEFLVGSHMRRKNNENISNNHKPDQRNVSLLNELQQEEEHEKEISIYAIDSAQTIQDVTQHHFKGDINMQRVAYHVATLRVMHCTQLTEMRGLNTYPNLKELNVSSNSVLSMSGLESLRCLEILNLSCNKITQIFNL